jgi:diaminohydroxyphosphoribosylaminopyrimidine deaminase/5-amino-6-(5-phosphoribosylamino)uracil reductase
MTDIEALRRACELAAGGYPAPNPHVGCVILRGNEVVGEGFHAFAGGPHAEVVALAAAGERAQGGTAYVTLEPCHHHGRTPPCSMALLNAGVARVVYAVPDPNPRAQGGAEALRAAGVLVDQISLPEAEAVNRVWLTAARRQSPYVILKVATTQDGYLARLDGTSKWITGEAARLAAHVLRAQMGAVLVGVGTVRADDPRLDARLPGLGRPVTKIVLDPQSLLSGSEKVFQSPGEVMWLREEVRGGVAGVLAHLWAQGVTSLLVEGGAFTLGEFLRAGAWDELHQFVAPTEWGEGIPWHGGAEPNLGEPDETRTHGPDEERIYWRH